MGRPKGSKSKFGNRKMLTARLPKSIIADLNAIAKFNNSSRTKQMEKYLRVGIEKSRRMLEKKFISYSIMILTLASIGLYIWYLFNI